MSAKKKKRIIPNQLQIKVPSSNLVAETQEERDDIAKYILRVIEETIPQFNKKYKSKKILNKFELEQLEEDVLKSQHTITCYLKSKPRIKPSIN